MDQRAEKDMSCSSSSSENESTTLSIKQSAEWAQKNVLHSGQSLRMPKNLAGALSSQGRSVIVNKISAKPDLALESGDEHAWHAAPDRHRHGSVHSQSSSTSVSSSAGEGSDTGPSAVTSRSRSPLSVSRSNGVALSGRDTGKGNSKGRVSRSAVPPATAPVVQHQQPDNRRDCAGMAPASTPGQSHPSPSKSLSQPSSPQRGSACGPHPWKRNVSGETRTAVPEPTHSNGGDHSRGQTVWDEEAVQSSPPFYPQGHPLHHVSPSKMSHSSQESAQSFRSAHGSDYLQRGQVLQTHRSAAVQPNYASYDEAITRPGGFPYSQEVESAPAGRSFVGADADLSRPSQISPPFVLTQQFNGYDLHNLREQQHARSAGFSDFGFHHSLQHNQTSEHSSRFDNSGPEPVDRRLHQHSLGHRHGTDQHQYAGGESVFLHNGLLGFEDPQQPSSRRYEEDQHGNQFMQPGGSFPLRHTDLPLADGLRMTHQTPHPPVQPQPMWGLQSVPQSVDEPADVPAVDGRIMRSGSGTSMLGNGVASSQRQPRPSIGPIGSSTHAPFGSSEFVTPTMEANSDVSGYGPFVGGDGVQSQLGSNGMFSSGGQFSWLSHLSDFGGDRQGPNPSSTPFTSSVFDAPPSTMAQVDPYHWDTLPQYKFTSGLFPTSPGETLPSPIGGRHRNPSNPPRQPATTMPSLESEEGDGGSSSFFNHPSLFIQPQGKQQEQDPPPPYN